jgi:hypothetical protein
MAGHLLLGPVLFRDYELPEWIGWGGRQRLAVHRLPGGRRVIDAMGRDDAAISWSGVFSGEDGAMRARLLDLMRAEGSAWPLNWGSFLYSVVVSGLSVRYERSNWLPYRIECTVLRDELAAFVDEAVPVAAMVAGDLALAGIEDGLDTAPAQALLATEGATRLGSDAYGPASAAVAQLAQQAEQGLALADAGAAAAGFGDANGLGAAAQAAGSLARAAQARAYAGRAAATMRGADS